MKVTFILLVFSFQSIAQSIDTVSFWDDTKLVTDLTLNDNGNCVEVDTSLSFHACDNYHGEEVILQFYPYDVDICDSIFRIESKKERNTALLKLKNSKKYVRSLRIRLLQDRAWEPNYYYSPEILFKIAFGEKEYYFNSNETNFRLDGINLNSKIEVKERLLGAFQIFGKSVVKIGNYAKNGKLIREFDSDLIISEGSIFNNCKEDISRIQIVISNHCRDQLIMNFIIDN